MRKSEIIKKNISLTFDFIRNVVDDPTLLNKVPDNSEIDFIETDLPSYALEDTQKNRNNPVTFRVRHVFCDMVAEKRP